MSLSRTNLLRWIGGGAVLAALLTALTIALWPASEADKARADGEQVGQAVAQLHEATSSDEVDAALVDLDTAVSDTADHAGDNVSDQVSDQADALYARRRRLRRRAQHRRRLRAGPLRGRARRRGRRPHQPGGGLPRRRAPEVQQAFWDGFDTGLDAA